MKRALILWGGWDGHQPLETSEIAAGLLRKAGYEVELSDSLEPLSDAARLAGLDLIVPAWTGGTLEKEQCVNLVAAVAGGCGLAGWHGGMGDTFKTNADYLFMMGGMFLRHPGNQVVHNVHIVDHDDPITAGIRDFSFTSERYYMLVDPGVHVLASVTFAAADLPYGTETVMPACWKRNYGKGRVFYLSPGHVAADFDTPELRELLKRGLLWAGR